jgi:hypothetical protein
MNGRLQTSFMPLSSCLKCLVVSGTILLTVIASACQKDSPAPDANTSLLANHSWRISAFADTDNTAMPPKTEDVFVRFPPYRRDDTYQFNSDNGLVFNDGLLKEDASDPQRANGSWQFQNNQTSLTITLNKRVALGTTGSTSSSTYDILKLSADTLRLTNGTGAQTVVVTLSR